MANSGLFAMSELPIPTVAPQPTDRARRQLVPPHTPVVKPSSVMQGQSQGSIRLAHLCVLGGVTSGKQGGLAQLWNPQAP